MVKLQLKLASIIRVPMLMWVVLIATFGHALAGQCPDKPCRNYPCICSFDELANWNANSVDPRQIAKVPLARRAVTSNPGLMIGLDFSGWDYPDKGDGATQGGPVGNLYPFNHWQYADIAYYYFHGLVSVPPVVWTDAAHRNGVKILGTVTADFKKPATPTEKEDPGWGGKKFNELFDTPEHAQTTQARLEEMARTFGFDGWIIDVENGAEWNPQVIDTLAKLKKDGFSAVIYEAFEHSLSHGSNILEAADTAGVWQSDYPGDPEGTYNTLSKSPATHLSRWNAYSAVNIFAAEDKDLTPPACAQGELSNTKKCLNLYGPATGGGETPILPTLDLNTNGNPPDGAWTSIGVYAPGWPAYAGSENFGDQLPPISTWRLIDEAIWDGTAPVGPLCSTSSSGALSKYVAARR